MAETAQRHLPAALNDLPAYVAAHSLAGASAAPASEWLMVVAPATRFILQWRTAARTAAGAAWGVESSEDACRARVTGDRALTAVPHSLVDVSHRQIALQLRGPHAATILNGACPLDLDLAEFPVGMCTRTVFAKADIVLWRTEADALHVEVWRSFAAYVTGLLVEIAREFGSEA